MVSLTVILIEILYMLVYWLTGQNVLTNPIVHNVNTNLLARSCERGFIFFTINDVKSGNP